MSGVRVCFDYVPDDDAEFDPEHKTGLTGEAWENLTDALMSIGAENIEVVKT